MTRHRIGSMRGAAWEKAEAHGIAHLLGLPMALHVVKLKGNPGHVHCSGVPYNQSTSLETEN